MEIISKELLSEVLGADSVFGVMNHYDKKGVNVQVKEFGIWKMYNIHELAHKCKEWALKYDHTIGSNITICSTSVSYIINYDGEEIIFEADTEPEAIFKACQWILEQKAKS